MAASTLASVAGEDQPQSLTFTMASTRPAMPTVTMTAAQRLGRGAAWPGTRGSFHQPTAMATSPIGTLTMKIQRQLQCTSTPPSSGPSAAANPPSAVQTRTAWARRSGGKLASSRPSEVGVISAAPTACSTRKPTSTAMLLAAPHAAEASGEQADAAQEAGVAPEPLGEASEEDQQRGIGDGVGVQHPGHVLQRHAAQAARHVREGHVDDEQIEVREADRDADDRQHPVRAGRPAATPRDG